MDGMSTPAHVPLPPAPRQDTGDDGVDVTADDDEDGEADVGGVSVVLDGSISDGY